MQEEVIPADPLCGEPVGVFGEAGLVSDEVVLRWDPVSAAAALPMICPSVDVPPLAPLGFCIGLPGEG